MARVVSALFLAALAGSLAGCSQSDARVSQYRAIADEFCVSINEMTAAMREAKDAATLEAATDRLVQGTQEVRKLTKRWDEMGPPTKEDVQQMKLSIQLAVNEAMEGFWKESRDLHKRLTPGLINNGPPEQLVQTGEALVRVSGAVVDFVTKLQSAGL